jgi:tetratricopeptide (TPR) repeat protein
MRGPTPTPAHTGSPCLGEDLVAALLDGTLDEATRAEAAGHLDACADCRRLVALAAASTPADRRSGTGLDESGLRAPVLGPGAAVARFRVLGAVGAGGMGIVYAAYDPELERKVAVKLLWGDAPDAAARQHRILREAQSMARLSHPNVVRVYDVGLLGDRVFVVMEFVEGTTLRRWLAEAPRAPRDVLRVMIGAGRGLAAAHAAGLIHRDFKPDNVLLGDGGRALVTDFGLAVAPGDEGGAPAARAGDGLVSRTGAVAGTPAYMAPEQMAGGEVDARSDVWSFSATLYEALFRERPFPARSADGIREAVLHGPAPAPPGKRGVPAHVRRAVLQGLERDPARRPASMTALIAALEHDPAATRRRAALGLALALAGAGAAAGVIRGVSPPSPACTGAEEKLAGAWDAPRREAVRAALLQSGKPWADQTWRRVEDALDSYARGWVAMRTDACRATRVTRVQSEALLDLRMSCLDARLADLSATTALLSKPADDLLVSATRAARSLPRLGACADTEALLAPVPPPADPAARVQVDALRREVAEVRALRPMGRYAEGAARAGDLVERARAVGYEPLLADALQIRSNFLDLGGDGRGAAEALKEGLWAAEGGRDRKRAAWILGDLVFEVGHQGGQPEAAHDDARHAAAILRALGGDAEIEAELASAEGAVLIDEGRYADAEKRYREAADKFLAAGGPLFPRYGSALNNVAVALGWQGRAADALPFQEKALEVHRAALGEHHPLFASTLSNIADVLRQLGRLGEARARAEEALTLATETVGPEHPIVASVEHVLGLVAMGEWKAEEADAHYARALALTEKLRGPDHPNVASYALDRAEALIALKRPAEAAQLAARAVAVYRKAGGSKEPLARAESMLGWALLDGGAPRDALEAFGRALAWQEAHAGDVRPVLLAGSRFGLARALVATHGDRARAKQLAEQALAGYVTMGDAAQGDLAAVEGFLDEISPSRER